jgi:hypothetical protein
MVSVAPCSISTDVILDIAFAPAVTGWNRIGTFIRRNCKFVREVGRTHWVILCPRPARQGHLLIAATTTRSHKGYIDVLL